MKKDFFTTLIFAAIGIAVAFFVFVVRSSWKAHKHYKSLCFVGPVLPAKEAARIKQEKKNRLHITAIAQKKARREAAVTSQKFDKLSRAEKRYRQSRTSSLFMVH